jgi:hypothetical protein
MEFYDGSELITGVDFCAGVIRKSDPIFKHGDRSNGVYFENVSFEVEEL